MRPCCLEVPFDSYHVMPKDMMSGLWYVTNQSLARRWKDCPEAQEEVGFFRITQNTECKLWLAAARR